MSELSVREYLRVSKDRKLTGKSPDQQHDENVASIMRQGWILHPDPPYRDTDRSASRYATKAREDFKRLIDDLEGDTFGADVLAIWESSRGSRRVGEWVDLVDLCKARSVRIWVTTHGRLYDPANARDRRSLLEDAVDAEYESEKTSERIRRDVRAAADKGKPHGKNVYGFLRVYDEQTRELLRVEEHPAQAPIVKEAARRVLDGDTFYAIAKDFNERGIAQRRPTRKEHRKNYGWTPPAVKQMLSMPAYAGKRQHQGEIVGDAMWPALIDFVTWKKLQIVMSPPEHKRTNDWPAKHLLAGIALCGVCGAPTRVGKQNAGAKKLDDEGNPLPRKTYLAYICSGVPGRPGPDGTKGFHVAMRQEHLDTVVTELVLTRLERPDFLAMVGERGQGNDTDRRAVLEEIAGYHAYLNEVRADAAAKLRFNLLLDQEARIEPLIKTAQARLEKLSEMDPFVLTLLSGGAIRLEWTDMELAKKRRLIRAVMAPRISRIGKGWAGQKGINYERVEPGWR
ncbi:recombinase family protein [Cryobacterium luteum]|uniref:Recombinase family protein n=1 Tax=Cryobacterium luteum TaxID=1424661 RepID=A0A1H8L3T1_9MICO|nr:recombinase family protein [Cryobacterium luteum]TFB90092.1 recombinase family protein [Cryobacterium luteum]SEN99832.1 Site-specific DNA recombinase [Cryobacterium luteum]